MSNKYYDTQMNKRTRRDRHFQTLIPSIILVVLSVLVMGMVWYFVTNYGRAQSSIVYTTDDIAHDKPIQAVHEMNGKNLEAIPFLPLGNPQPEIVIQDDFFDFGSVGPTEVVRHDFVIANLGQAPLTISRAYTTCGCTTAVFTASVIPSGNVSIVTMIYDAGLHDARGLTVRRGIIIENNDPKNPQVELWAQAVVRENP
jgi:hypothetical protein